MDRLGPADPHFDAGREVHEWFAGRLREPARGDQLVVNPDCGLRHLPPDAAEAKLRAMTLGAAIVRGEVTGTAGPVL